MFRVQIEGVQGLGRRLRGRGHLLVLVDELLREEMLRLLLLLALPPLLLLQESNCRQYSMPSVPGQGRDRVGNSVSPHYKTTSA